MKKKLNYADIVKETVILTVAVAIIAAAVYFFLVPSHTSVSSISGLGIVLSNFVPLQLSAITMILNVVLLIIGFFTCGREFGVKTVYTSVMLPLFLGLFEIIFPNFGSMTDSQELDVLCYILVVSVGLSILFNRNASSGGLDIVAKIMNKYLHMELGKAMSLSGMCVALSAALVYDKKTVVLSILGTYFNGIVLDHFIFDHNIKRRVCIITKKEEELRQFIVRDLHSGATIYEAIGAYNMEKRNDESEVISHLAVIHHETTTGLLNDIKSIGKICGQYGIEMIVDAMSSFAGIPIDMEEMNIKYLASSSNKCIQGMAGISFVIANKESLEKTKNIKPRNLYLNMYKQYSYFKDNYQMRFTPPVQILYALKQAIIETKEETIENRYARYKNCCKKNCCCIKW